MKRCMVTLVASLAALLMVSVQVRADGIPWGYSSVDTEIFNNNNPAKSSSIKFKGSSGVAGGDSGIIIYNLLTSSTATDAAPDSFTDVPFNLAVNFTDIKTTGSVSPGAKAKGTVNFAGLFNASNVTKESLLPGLTTITSPTSVEVVLGADDVGYRKYTVSLNSLTSSGAPGDPGSVLAVIQITPSDGPGGSGEEPPPPSGTPEPASLLLAGLGLPLFIVARRRLKKAE